MRRKSRTQKEPAEEKIRIVLEGLRGEESIAALSGEIRGPSLTLPTL